MKREEFIERLEEKKIGYNILDNNIEITGSKGLSYKGDVSIYDVKKLPSGVIFNNKGKVVMTDLEEIPEGVQFNNEGIIILGLSPNNDLGLSSKGIKIHPSVVFNNGDERIMVGYISTGEYLFNTSGLWGESWKGSIDDINTKRLFNLMVKRGVFQ